MNVISVWLHKNGVNYRFPCLSLWLGLLFVMIGFSSPISADYMPSHGQKGTFFPGFSANESAPLNLNITVNTTDYTIEAAENQSKQRINYILSSMLDPSKGNMNLSDITVVPYSVSQINATGTSLEKIYGNKSVYRVTSIIHVNTTPKERTKVFQATMPKLLNDETLMKASYSASYERK